MAEASLGVPKSERHEFQASLVGMIEEALSTIKASQAEEVQKLKDEVVQCPSSKAKRETDVVEREKELAVFKEAIASKKAELEAEEKAESEARDAVEEAKKEKKKVDKEHDKVAAKLEAVKLAQTEHFAFVKENATPANHGSYKTVVKTCKDIGVENVVLTSFAEVAKKPKETRTEFEQEVLQKIETLLAQKVEEVTGTVAEGEAAKAAGAEKVAAALAAQEAAGKRVSDADEALTAAKDAEKAGQKDLKDAQKAVSGWLSDCKRTMDAYDAAIAMQADFASALSAFDELKELEPPPPEPEPVEEEPAAAEAAPAEQPVA